MQYEGVIYRPPSEADSLIIQATIGCPHNRCRFCNMYRDKKFRIRSVAEIKKDIDWVKDNHPPAAVASVFLADGNSILMKTSQLLEVIKYAYDAFPRLQRLTSYGASQYLARKPANDFKELRAAGLTRIHTGVESGYDPLLQRLQKGGSAATHIAGGQKVRQADIELSMYYMPGLGGEEIWREHALASARVFNEVDPDFIRLRTFIPIAGTPAAQDYAQGAFALMGPWAVIREIRLLLEHLEVKSMFLSDHWSNFINLRGQLPHDRERLLREADLALTWPESAFRELGITQGAL
jgi:radical SAM superfamily enzyme YgiQ (UPF0313 family)